MTKEQIIKSIECCEADFCAGCPIDNNNGDCRVKMAEYKDVELLKKQIADFKRAVNSVKPMNSDYLTGYISALSVVEGAIADQPTADAAPVRHGRWLSWEEMFPDKTPRRKNNLGVFCSKCKLHNDNRNKYCPNCGAIMDEQ